MRSGAARASLLPGILEQAAFALACAVVWAAPVLAGGTQLWAISTLSLFGLLSLLLTLLSGVLGRLPRAQNPLWVAFAALFLVWTLSSNLWTAYAHEGWRSTALWGGVLGAALTLHLFATTARRHALVIGGMVVAGVLTLVAALLQARGVYLLPSLPRAPGQDYLTGTYFHPSHFSGYLMLPAALLSSLLFFTRAGVRTLLWLGLLGLTLYLNYQTDGSSIPGPFLVVALTFVVWAWRRRPWLGVSLSALGVAGLALVAFLLFVPRGQALFERYRADFGFRSTSVTAFVDCRKNVYATDLRMWRASPLRGLGVGQFYWESSAYRGIARGSPCEFTNVGLVNYAHNDYLQVAAELGAVGLGLWLLMQLSSVLRRPRSIAELSWISAFVAYALVGLYDAHLTYIGGTMMVAYALSALKLPPLARKAGPPPALPALERDPSVPLITVGVAKADGGEPRSSAL